MSAVGVEEVEENEQENFVRFFHFPLLKASREMKEEK